jgi:hypothetical protein
MYLRMEVKHQAEQWKRRLRLLLPLACLTYLAVGSSWKAAMLSAEVDNRISRLRKRTA